MKTSVNVLWNSGPVNGRVVVSGGTLTHAAWTAGRGTCNNTDFTCRTPAFCRMRLTIEHARLTIGAFATTVTLLTDRSSFTFFLRDVNRENPVYIPAYGVAVTPADDDRSFEQIRKHVRSLALRTRIQTINAEPEESFDQAARHSRNMWVPTWLGLGRDHRIFELDFNHLDMRDNRVLPRWRPNAVTKEELESSPLDFRFVLGRGTSGTHHVTRRLENGTLPILHAEIIDDDIRYDCTAFASLEKTPLIDKNVRGTHYLFADGNLDGHMFTPQQQEEFDAVATEETRLDEEVVLFFRARATNTAMVPRYAFFKTPSFAPWTCPKYTFEGGLSAYKTGRVFCTSKMDGRPMPQEEVSVLLAPGRSATLEFYLPHDPIDRKRALKLIRTNFDKKIAECRSFWQAKLDQGAQISVPEKRIHEMIQAGLLHLDLALYGREPNGTVAPSVGAYPPIGSESSPIIQFIDSMARHKLAERCLQFFLNKQHDDGFIQNFSNYMLETGAALWSMGEHYRYTRDEKWVRRIKPNLLKACEYLDRWRKRNMREELRGKGYGLMDGKAADPEDPYHAFMLNGYSYLGLIRVAEMLEKSDPAQSRRIKRQALALKADIRAAFLDCLARGPVVPIGDGSWIPTSAPWVEYQGPVCLFAQGQKWYSHGTMTVRDALIGPLYLVFQEVLDPGEPAADFLINFQVDLMCSRNVAFSQPYYSPHPFVHLKRDEVKPFLKSYYNTVSALADRQTYTFWEHFHQVTPHKTHEEAWFLMQTRWMLYMEEGDTLKLLRGIPRQWLNQGNRIRLKNVATYFGPLALDVMSNIDFGTLNAAITCKANRRPKTVEIRLPHPFGLKATSIAGGTYNPETETVRINHFTGQAHIALSF